MRIKILLFIILVLPISVSALSLMEKKVGDRIYLKIKEFEISNSSKIDYLEDIKSKPQYYKYEEIFDYVILKIKLEDDNFCDEVKYCSGLNSCLEAKVRLKYCGHKSLDKDNDSIPCENICK